MSVTVEITPEFVAFADGKFDSRFRYFRTKAATGEVNFVAGKTCFVAGAFSGSVWQFGFRYSVDGYVASQGTLAASGDAVFTRAATE
jgi:hypothetical protein